MFFVPLEEDKCLASMKLPDSFVFSQVLVSDGLSQTNVNLLTLEKSFLARLFYFLRVFMIAFFFVMFIIIVYPDDLGYMYVNIIVKGIFTGVFLMLLYMHYSMWCGQKNIYIALADYKIVCWRDTNLRKIKNKLEGDSNVFMRNSNDAHVVIEKNTKRNYCSTVYFVNSKNEKFDVEEYYSDTDAQEMERFLKKVLFGTYKAPDYTGLFTE